MPPLRLSLARALSRLRRPKLASAKDLNLESVSVVTMTRAVRLPIQASEPVRSLPVDPGEVAGPGLEVHGLERPVLEELPAFLGEAPVEPFDLARREGAPIHGGRAPWRGGKPDENRLLAVLWPALNLPYFPAEEELGAISEGLLAHQIEAARQLLEQDALFLADDPGTGKLASAAVALGSLVQRGAIRRALLLAPASRHLRWLGAFAKWTPGLSVSRFRGDGTQDPGEIMRANHLVMSEYLHAAEEMLPEPDAAHPNREGFDLVIADSVLAAVHKIPQGLGIAVRFESPRRWALAGGLPRQAEDWRTLFGFLLPGQPIGPSEAAEGLQDRLSTHLIRRTKKSVAGNLPNRHRIEHWLELDTRQEEAYGTAWSEEKHMLEQLGEAASRTHIESALGALNRATAFAQGSLDGVKVRALADLLEALSAVEEKMIVFSQYRHRALEPLQQALHAYGALRLTETARPDERDQILATFRRDPSRQVLLAHLDARSDGEPMPASYIVHFDIGWNSARRIRAEQRFFPELKPEVPLTIYEYWIRGTHDEALHSFLASKGLLAGDLPLGTRPAELEERMTVDDWRRNVFGAMPETVGEPAKPAWPGAKRTTGLLPGTAVLRRTLADLSEAELHEAVGELMGALGFPEVERLELDPEAPGISLLAAAEETEERVLVWARQQDENVGVAAGRELLEALEERQEAEAAYLVATSDFTPACKTLADESDGRLALVSGSEFFRHLRILGRL